MVGGFFCLLFMDKVKALLPDFQRCWEFAVPFEPARSCKCSELPPNQPPLFLFLCVVTKLYVFLVRRRGPEIVRSHLVVLCGFFLCIAAQVYWIKYAFHKIFTCF